MAEGRYWSIEHCGWVASPTGDALVTPWSAHGLPVPGDGPTPRDGFDLLRARTGRLPAQRQVEGGVDAPVPPSA